MVEPFKTFVSECTERLVFTKKYLSKIFKYLKKSSFASSKLNPFCLFQTHMNMNKFCSISLSPDLVRLSSWLFTLSPSVALFSAGVVQQKVLGIIPSSTAGGTQTYTTFQPRTNTLNIRPNTPGSQQQVHLPALKCLSRCFCFITLFILYVVITEVCEGSCLVLFVGIIHSVASAAQLQKFSREHVCALTLSMCF